MHSQLHLSPIDLSECYLLLTDSIHSSTPTHIFEAVPNHVCIKHKEYQLANIDQYSSEFEYTDVVVISMGINDLSRYGHKARTLADSITPKLQHYSRRYPHCKFIFSTRNLSFFDSHHFAAKTFKEDRSIASFYVPGPSRRLSQQSMRNEQSNNGIHIPLHMRRLITSELVRSVGYLAGARCGRFRRCEM